MDLNHGSLLSGMLSYLRPELLHMVHARLLVSVAVGRDRYATPGLWLAAAGQPAPGARRTPPRWATSPTSTAPWAPTNEPLASFQVIQQRLVSGIGAFT